MALFAGAGNPVNKVIGVGFDEPPAPVELERLEQRYHAAGAPVRVEMSTLARAESHTALSRRGDTSCRDSRTRVGSAHRRRRGAPPLAHTASRCSRSLSHRLDAWFLRAPGRTWAGSRRQTTAAPAAMSRCPRPTTCSRVVPPHLHGHWLLPLRGVGRWCAGRPGHCRVDGDVAFFGGARRCRRIAGAACSGRCSTRGLATRDGGAASWPTGHAARHDLAGQCTAPRFQPAVCAGRVDRPPSGSSAAEPGGPPVGPFRLDDPLGSRRPRGRPLPCGVCSSSAIRTPIPRAGAAPSPQALTLQCLRVIRSATWRLASEHPMGPWCRWRAPCTPCRDERARDGRSTPEARSIPHPPPGVRGLIAGLASVPCSPVRPAVVLLV